MTDDKRCTAYDQILNRNCCYDEGHGGRHNFARLDHDSALERALRRALDEMTSARDELANIAESEALDETYSPKGTKLTLERIADLRKVGT